MPIHVTHKFGRNPTVGTSWEDIWEAGGRIVWQTEQETLTIVSTSTEDGADGEGARTIMVQGVDAAFAIVLETVTMNGTTPVITTNSFLGAVRAWVITAGVTAGGDHSNVGTITIVGTDSGDEHLRLSVINSRGVGQTLFCGWIIPADYGPTCIHSMLISVDATKVVTVGLFTMFEGESQRLRLLLDSLTGVVPVRPSVGMGPFPVGTRIWASGFTEVSTASVSVRMELVAQPEGSRPGIL